MSELGVVHLVREGNGIEPFRDFLESYREREAGIAHELLIVFKGFDESQKLIAYRALLEGIEHQSLHVPDTGYDIGSYFLAARNFKHRYFCFLNSFSVILDSEWLVKLHRQVVRQGVGLVGATGSAESSYTNYCVALGALPPMGFNLPHLYQRYLLLRDWWRLRSGYEAFPNYHIRTNAFMLARELMLKLKVKTLRSKRDVELFESGRANLTRQINAKKLKALVVGRDGVAYEKPRWFESETFRSGDQSNLLVADNRTKQYATADSEFRQTLTEYAWGKK